MRDAAGPPPRITIGVMTAPSVSGAERRARWRVMCAEKHRYAQRGISWKFFVGVPLSRHENVTTHNQFHNATPKDITLMRSISREVNERRDMVVLPLLDYYTRIHLKLLQMLEWIVRRTPPPLSGAYISKLDDDNCIDVDVLLGMIDSDAEPAKVLYPFGRGATSEPEYVYGGSFRFPKPDYPLQKGHDGSFRSYYSGHGYFMSAGLVEAALELTDPPPAYYHRTQTGRSLAPPPNPSSPALSRPAQPRKPCMPDTQSSRAAAKIVSSPGSSTTLRSSATSRCASCGQFPS